MKPDKSFFCIPFYRNKKIMIIKIWFVIIIVIFSFGCKKYNNTNTALAEMEKKIRDINDKRAVFTYQQYDSLLNVFNDDKYCILPIDEFYNFYDPSKVLISLRHDVDNHPFKALEMANMEYAHNFRASYYLLPTAYYYGTFKYNKFIRNEFMSEIYTKIYNLNHEIGMHNDLLTVMIDKHMNVKQFNLNEIEYFRSLGIEIIGTVAHGSTISLATVPNYEIFKEFASSDHIIYKNKTYPIGIDSLKNFGFSYEAYFVDHNKYISDVGGKWNLYGFSEKMSGPVSALAAFTLDNSANEQNSKNQNYEHKDILNLLKNAVPGDRIIILTHPYLWGKE
jgi:hypothetical protein